MLTAEQLAAFEVFGYLRFDALFSPPEIREISREFDDLIVHPDRTSQVASECG